MERQHSDIRANRPNAQAFDEVRITTRPRWKESEISGDEWRISGHIEFFLKGHKIGGSSWLNVETALRYGDWAVVDMFENGRNGGAHYPDVKDLCDQEGCSERATHKYRMKRRYRNDGSVKESFDGCLEHRCFCSRHKFRGDCGLDDADQNYELIEELVNLSAIDKQNAEFEALEGLIVSYTQQNKVPVVDDDYPRVRQDYESALKNFLNVSVINRPRDFQRVWYCMTSM